MLLNDLPEAAHPTESTLQIGALIARRQQVSPKRLDGPGPSTRQIKEIWTAAAQAPDHGLILPWRFVQVGDAARERLGAAFEQALLERDPEATQLQRDNARAKAARAPFLALAIARLHGDAHPEIPAAERLVSLGCALQNVLLTAHALDFGAGLVSGQSMDSAALRGLFDLKASERAICFVAIGTVTRSKKSRQRPTPDRFVTAL